MKARFSLSVLAVLLLLVLGVGVGCNQAKAKADSQITSEIQSKFSQDSGLQGKPLTIETANGVVTIGGTVDNQTERDAAARLAASIEGVKTVVNNLEVAPAMAEQTASAPAPVEEPKPAPKPRARHRRSVPTSSMENEPAPQSSTHVAAAPTMMEAVNTAPPAPPAPTKVTIPSGTTLAVRLVDTIDSETAQQGQTFRATLESPLALEGDVVIPAGYDVEGHIVDVKSAGKFAGQSLLALQLDRIAVRGKYYSIQTDQWRRQGSSRTKNTAAKVGTGAAIGAIIGGIAGGGKGAAIGAAAGGGLGGGVQAATKGQQIKLSSETVLNFTLQAPLTVIPTTQGPNSNRQKLENN
ncbi:MAG TPA: BON domain-containing protein [Terriglobales bacterium]|nr:BON domain-containing protein [Terriglobales bacterium]